MKCSELIARLEKAIAELGDVDVYCIPSNPGHAPAHSANALWHWPANDGLPERLEIG